jgi:hypothetical protein
MVGSAPGVFDFIKDPDQREILEYDYKIVTDNNLWDLFKNNNSDKPIMFLSELSDYNWWGAHSGASWGLCMRDLEFIAKNGWESYTSLYK